MNLIPLSKRQPQSAESSAKPIVKRTSKKRSNRAILAARNISEKLGKGIPVNLGEELLNVGYSKTVSETPQVVTETKSFKEAINPVLVGMEKARDAIIAELGTERRIKSFKKERLVNLATTLKGLTHDIQLVSGGDTERDGGAARYFDKLNELQNAISANRNKK